MEQQNLLIDFSTRSFCYGALAILASQLNPSITLRSGLVVSVINSAFVTAGNRLTDTEKNPFVKTLVTAAALALSTIVVSNKGASLAKRLNLNLPNEAAFQLTFTSVVGELVKTSLPFIFRQTIPLPPIENCSEDVRKVIENTPQFKRYKVEGPTLNFKVMESNVRPANLFFNALELDVVQPGQGVFAFNTPPADVREKLCVHDSDDIIEISAQGKSCTLYGREASMEAGFGNAVYQMSYEEVLTMMESQRIHLSPLLPKAFYLALKRAMANDRIVILPGSDRNPMTLEALHTKKSEYPNTCFLLDAVMRDPSQYGFSGHLSFDTLYPLTLYQIGSMVVKTEDYHCFIGDGYQIVSRNIGDRDQLHLINACGIRGFYRSQDIPGNANHELDRRIMKETFKVSMESIGEGGFYTLPAVGLGVWGGTPDIYWSALLDTIVELDIQLENIIVCPGHQTTPGTNLNGQEFGEMLSQYKIDHPENQNLSRVIDLYYHKIDVVLLAKHLKAKFPEKVVALQNASDPDVTLGQHVDEYVNRLSHPSTTEENYSAIGTNCLNFEAHTQVLEHDERVIVH